MVWPRVQCSFRNPLRRCRQPISGIRHWALRAHDEETRTSPMRGISRLLVAIAVAGCTWPALGSLEVATAQVPTKQIVLSEKQVERFIAAQTKMAAAKAEGEFDAIAREYGFTGIEEHDDVEANILLLFEGFDPKSRDFLQPPVQIKRLIEETRADKSLPEDERKQALDELTEALKSAKPIQYPTNVELIRKYYDQLRAVLE
jgi:hypothetical protein